MIHTAWWKDATIYQIYVRSFYDKNGDGIGDLKGLIEKIPYLIYLGVDAVYLNPINKSPNADFGYDVSDFYDIAEEFGTLADFDDLVSALHRSGMKLILDLVINHSSDEHPWFQEAKKSRENPFHDFYLWHDGKPDGSPPNNWPSFFGGSAWTYNESTKEYYLHLFSSKQPDFNFTSEDLRSRIKDIVRFWICRGVDGFRFDAINHIAKDMAFPDGASAKGELYGDFIPHVQNLPEVHDYLKELRRDAIPEPHILVSGEAGGIGCSNAHLYTGEASGELDILFHFDLHSVGRGPKDWIRIPVDIRRTIKKSFSCWSTRPKKDGWNPVFFSNHDTSRTVSRLGDETLYREDSAKALCLLQFTQRGTPFIYYGDEIGMTNARNFSLKDYRDIAVTNHWREDVLNGMVDPAEFLEGLHNMNRDNARTPMQWSDEPGAGFSAAEPWIPLNGNYHRVNLKSQAGNPASVLEFYRRAIALRKKHPVLTHGGFTEYLSAHPQIYAYTRQDEDTACLILLNLSSDQAKAELPPDLLANLSRGEGSLTLLLGTPPDLSSLPRVTLAPWQATVWQMESIQPDKF